MSIVVDSGVMHLSISDHSLIYIVRKLIMLGQEPEQLKSEH